MGNVPLDAVTVEVVRAALNAAAERMRITMIKTAYNHIISESLDFGCAIFDPDVQMIAQGIGLPVFQGHLGFPIQATLADRGLEAFREGDVFIHNDPYAGNGNHLNDVAMYAPVFWEGLLTGFISVKAHWSDVGGPVPSSMQVGSREFRQEGLRFQSVRLFSRGELNDEVMRMIRGNIRTESGTMTAAIPCSTPRASTSSSPSGAPAPSWPASRPGPTARWPTSTTTASASTSRCGSRWRSRWARAR